MRLVSNASMDVVRLDRHSKYTFSDSRSLVQVIACFLAIIQFKYAQKIAFQDLSQPSSTSTLRYQFKYTCYSGRLPSIEMLFRYMFIQTWEEKLYHMSQNSWHLSLSFETSNCTIYNCSYTTHNTVNSH